MAEQVASTLERVRGIKNVGVFHIMGQSNLTLPIDRDKCAHWNVTAQGVQNVIQTAVGGLACTQMIEGEKNFDVTLRWPENLRDNTAAILDIPVDVGANVVETDAGPRSRRRQQRRQRPLVHRHQPGHALGHRHARMPAR